LALVGAAVGGGVVALALGAGLYMRSPAGLERARVLIEEEASASMPGADLRVGRLQVVFRKGLFIEGVALVDPAGRPLIALDELVVKIAPLQLLGRRVTLREVTISGLRVIATPGPDGTLDLASAFSSGDDSPAEPEPWSGIGPWTVEVERLRLQDGAFTLADPEAPVSVPRVGLDAALSVSGRQADVTMHRLAVGIAEPLKQRLELRGGLGYDDGHLFADALRLSLGDSHLQLTGWVRKVETDPGLGLTIDSAHVAPEDVASLAGDEVLRRPLDLTGQISGPLDDLELVADARTDGAGGLHLVAGANTTVTPLIWRARAETDGLSLDRLLTSVTERVHLDTAIRAEGVGTSWPDALTAGFSVASGEQIIWGEPVRALTLEGRVAGGVVHLARAEVAHGLGTASLSGSVDPLASTADVEVTAAIPTLAELRRFELPGYRGRVDYAGPVTVDWSDAETVAVVAEGRLDVARVVSPDVQIGRAGGPLKVKVVGEAVTASGWIRASDVLAGGVGVASVEGTWSTQVAPGGAVAVQAQLEAGDVTAGDGALEISRTKGTTRVSVAPSGAVAVKADLDLSELLLGPERVAVDGGPVSMEYTGDGVIARFDLDRSERPVFHGLISADLATQTWEIRDLVLAPDSHTPVRSDEPVRFRLTDGGIRDIQLAVGGEHGGVHISGDWLPAGTAGTDLTARVDELHLPWVVRIATPHLPPGTLPDTTGLHGVLDAQVHITGDGAVLHQDSRLLLRDFSYPDVADDLTIAAESRGVLDAPAFSVDIAGDGGPLLAAEGRLPLVLEGEVVGLDCDGQLHLDAIVPPGGMSRFMDALPAAPPLAGEASAELRASGAACDPDLDLVAAWSTPLAARQFRFDLELVRDGADLLLEAAVEEDMVRRAEIHGAAKTHLGEVLRSVVTGTPGPPLDEPASYASALHLSVVPLGVPVEALRPFVDLPQQIGGRISGGMLLTGRLARPVLQGGLQWSDGEIGKVDISHGTVSLLPAEGGYELDGRLVFSGEGDDGEPEELGDLELEGFVPLVITSGVGETTRLDRPGLDIEISGAGLPLITTSGLIPGVSEASGLLTVEGDVTGTLAEPLPNLTIELTDGALDVAETGVQYTGITMDADVSPDRIMLNTLIIGSRPRYAKLERILGGSNELRINGAVLLDHLTPGRFQLKVYADGFHAMHTPLFSAQLLSRGDTTVTGTWPDLIVRGEMEMLEGEINLGESLFLDDSALELNPAIRVHRRVKPTPTRELIESDLLSTLDAEFLLSFTRPVPVGVVFPLSADYGRLGTSLSTVEVEAEITSDELNVVWSDGEPALYGTVEVESGMATLLGSDFTIEDGSAFEFIDGAIDDPLIQLKAERETPYGAVSAEVTGKTDDMRVQLSSNDFPDESDIMAILLFGKPISEMTNAEGETRGLAISAAVGLVAASSLKRFNDMFKNLELGQEGWQAGTPLGDRAFVTYRKSFEQVEGENQAEWTLEVFMARRSSLELLTGDAGQSSVDLYWRWRW